MRHVLLIIVLFPVLTFSEDFDIGGNVQTFTNAELISRDESKYPRIARKLGKEGWVILSFVISEDGRVIDTIVEDSSGYTPFEKAAIKHVETSQYKPALSNGKPTEQCHTKIKYLFELKDIEPGVNRAFLKRYRRIVKLIESGNMDEADKIIEELKEQSINNLTEDAWFWWIKSIYHQKKGEKNQTYESLLRAIAYEGVYLPEDIYFAALTQLYVAEVNAAQYAIALETFSKIEDANKEDVLIDTLQKNAQKIREIIESKNTMIINASISDEGLWTYKLNRREFSFGNVSGEIDKFEIRCDKYRQVFKFSNENTWKTPESWGECYIYVYGDQNTIFNLNEYAS